MALICFLSLESLGRVKLDFSVLTKVTADFPAAETSVLCSLPGTCHPPALPGGIFFQGLSISLTSPLESIPHLRIDTHRNNLVMQHVVEKHGFSRRGIIFVEDGTERIAYERL